MNKINKCIKYIFLSNFKNWSMFAYVLILPLLIQIILFYFYINRSIKPDEIIAVGPFLSLSIIVAGTFIPYFLISWRETVFLRQLQNFGIKKWEFLFSMAVVFSVYALSSYIFSSSVLCILDSFTINKVVLKYFDGFFRNKAFILMIINLWILSLMILMVNILISGRLTNIYLAQVFVVLFIVWILIFGDFFIHNSLTQMRGVLILSYLNPVKYVNWVYYLTYSGTLWNLSNTYYIIANPNYFVSFKYIYGPLFSSLIFVTCFSYFSHVTLNNGLKK
ncbi:hypothetical protein SCHIN_v1c09190 [Spiroplasma chinense]|uniref:Uncharacterized protein n=1 Tax=Spiroplasma chinense TaxID=216932 RepID=A0A5B9Y5N1_9MOLU|nr:hypothetical protein [Spiroplasma chinense]QEH62113.1 hypothetical protein SCHIN_v1c09190 [Spiroplasma chinense]